MTIDAGPLGFVRSDSNADGTTDVSDPIWTLNFLFRNGPRSTCLDSADANDDGRIDLSDSVYSLTFTFQEGPRPPDPFLPACGPDPTVDALDCVRYAPCE